MKKINHSHLTYNIENVNNSHLTYKIENIKHPIVDTRISVLWTPPSSSVTLRGPPLYSETGFTGELWWNGVLLILKN